MTGLASWTEALKLEVVVRDSVTMRSSEGIDELLQLGCIDSDKLVAICALQMMMVRFEWVG